MRQQVLGAVHDGEELQSGAVTHRVRAGVLCGRRAQGLAQPVADVADPVSIAGVNSLPESVTQQGGGFVQVPCVDQCVGSTAGYGRGMTVEPGPSEQVLRLRKLADCGTVVVVLGEPCGICKQIIHAKSLGWRTAGRIGKIGPVQPGCRDDRRSGHRQAETLGRLLTEELSDNVGAVAKYVAQLVRPQQDDIQI